MKKMVCFISLFAFFAMPLPAQMQRTDSLYKVMSKFKKQANFQKDTNYLNLLHELAFSYDSTQPDSLLAIAERCKTLSEQVGYKKGVSRSLQDMAIYYYGTGNYMRSAELLRTALQIAEEIQHLKTIASCYNNIALIYSVQKQHKKALNAHFKVVELRKKMRDEYGMATSYNNIGSIYNDLKDFKTALEYDYKSLEINQKYNDKQGLAYNYNNMGYELRMLNRTDEALVSLEKALKLVDEIGDTDLKSEVLHHLAYCEIAKKDYEKALKFMQASLEIGEKLNKKLTLRDAYEGLSQVYENLGKFHLAVYYQRQFKKVYDEIVNDENIKNAHHLQAQYEYDKKEAILKAEQHKNLAEQRFYTFLAITALGSVLIIVWLMYRSRMRILEANQIILKQKEEIESQNADLAERKVEIESQNAELEAQAEYLRDINALKDRLLSIIGHDLKTPINQIKGILPILEAGGLSKEDFQFISGGIKQSLTHASDLLDNLFRWALSQLGGEMLKPQVFDLRFVIETNIELYEQVAEKKKVRITNHLGKSVRVYADFDMIDLVVRNLLSNALKFCLPNQTIDFVVIEHDRVIQICVRDTGVGISTEILPTLFGKGHTSQPGTAGEKGTGLGLTLCRDFVEKNGGKIWVDSQVGKGSSFYFTVPKG